ncbi:MAG: AbrB/MazE/SpoVT family DNA-binding domain-containing protein [Chloroflexi bacterium]|nr:AbrB/MazE/SpoVT family DNA-binding domain-containing protein [Chloroflexota bacterium]
MATAEVKRVLKLGGSLAIVLPKTWLKGRIKAGQEMVVVGDGELRIIPVHSNESPVQDQQR